MDISKIKMTRNYLGGMTFETYATRNYSYLITNTKLKGVKIIQSIYTPRINEFEWGVQENEYWIEGHDKVKYKTLEEVIINIDL